MNNRRGYLIQLSSLVIMLMISGVLFINANQGKGKPLACLAMSSADSSFTNEIVRELKTRLIDCGNRVLISYCDNDVNTQISQIENYIAMHPAILVIDCMGNEMIYDDILNKVHGSDTQVIVFGASGNMKNADIQMVSSMLGRGICASVLIRDFLNRTGQSEEQPSAKVLLLGNAATERDIMTMAGYQLMAEKFLRRYDMKALSFVKEKGDTVYYTDGYGVRRVVEEPTGGLILDENGDAIPNLYYESRIQLITADNYMNIQTNIQGQNALETFLGDADNRDIRIVVATSGEAAIGAARSLETCISRGELKNTADKIAVFGAYNTEQNCRLVSEAYKGNGVFRGFVGDFSIKRAADNMLRSLLTEKRGNYPCYSFYSGYNAATDETGIVVLYDSGISSRDLFHEEAKNE